MRYYIDCQMWRFRLNESKDIFSYESMQLDDFLWFFSRPMTDVDTRTFDIISICVRGIQ